jgi:3-deoxy-D-manno-octulosonate 8-phosphate phosphatase (KDO 8-P phosphatase)
MEYSSENALEAVIPASRNPGLSSLTLAERCARIELLVVDVDGVLTDGGIVYTDNGVEVRSFHVRDGSGLKLWRLAGKGAALISGRASQAVAVRAAELGLAPVVQGAANKLPAFRTLLSEAGRQPEEVCYIGDDVPDLPVLRDCGLAAAVADACPEVRAVANYVTRAPGGRGAVREVIELILRCQGRWQRLVEQVSAAV